MTLRNLLSERRIRPHDSSAEEIADLFQVVGRDLQDTQVANLSPDRRFTTAYNAALQLATVVLRAAGYRTTGSAHHWVTFHVLPELLPPGEIGRADYFDACRRKRNTADYDAVGMISDAEVKELLGEVGEFRKDVITWLQREHSNLYSSNL